MSCQEPWRSRAWPTEKKNKQTNKQTNITSTSQQRQQEQNGAGAETVEKVAEAYR